MTFTVLCSGTLGRDFAFEFEAEDPEDAEAKAIVHLMRQRRDDERIVEKRLFVNVPFGISNEGWSVKA